MVKRIFAFIIVHILFSSVFAMGITEEQRRLLIAQIAERKEKVAAEVECIKKEEAQCKKIAIEKVAELAVQVEAERKEEVVTDSPCASIASWAPGAIASGKILAQRPDLRKRQELMPVWVQISFNQKVTNDFLNKFFSHLHRLVHAGRISMSRGCSCTSQIPKRHGKNRENFVVTIHHSITQKEFQGLLDQASTLCIDPAVLREREARLAEAQLKAVADAEAEGQRQLLAAQAKAEHLAKYEAEQEKLRVAKMDAEADRQAREARAVAEALRSKKIVEQALPLLCDAIKKDSLEEIQEAMQLITSHGKIDQLVGPIVLALSLKKYAALKILLDSGVDINTNLIEYAISLNDFKIAYLIVTRLPKKSTFYIYAERYMNFGLNYFNSSSIPDSDRQIALDLIQELIGKKHYDINKLWRKVPVTKEGYAFLIDNGADLNYNIASDGSGYGPLTPLILAIRVGNIPAIKAILDAGADVNKKGRDSDYTNPILKSPLNIALEYKTKNQQAPEIIRLLVEHGASM